VKVTLVPKAERELIGSAARYTREATTELGEAFIAEFERSALLLARQPQLGAVWRGNVRRLPLRRFPYTIVYIVDGDSIRVLAVAHQRRKPGFWSGRR